MSSHLNPSFALRVLTACAIALAAAACTGPKGSSSPTTASTGASAEPSTAAASTVALDPILADPKVGDLYAAELNHFSGATFEGSNEHNYGLMRVIEVSADKITLNTETGSWPLPRGAINELRGDQADIEWDTEEKVHIYRKELAQLVADKKILEVRRK